jgi:hypothetical protein
MILGLDGVRNRSVWGPLLKAIFVFKPQPPVQGMMSPHVLSLKKRLPATVVLLMPGN